MAKEEAMKRTKTYEAPTVITIDGETLASILGPSVSCTGFGGSVDGC